MSFAGWLIMNRWLTFLEAPALHVLWHDGDDAGAIRRAVKAREYVVSEERVGRNVDEGGGDILCRTLARRVVEDSRIGNRCIGAREVSLGQEFEVCDKDHLRGRL